MGIMSGNEEAWLKLMLQDSKILEELNLPSNMTDEEVSNVIEMILNSSEAMAELHKQDEEALENLGSVFTEKSEDETPCDWMVREAMGELGFETEELKFKLCEEVVGSKLVTDNYYQITFPSDKTAVVKLNRIMPNSFGDDYVFENISGAENLTAKANSGLVGMNEFPLPEQLLSVTTFHRLELV